MVLSVLLPVGKNTSGASVHSAGLQSRRASILVLRKAQRGGQGCAEDRVWVFDFLVWGYSHRFSC